jgi:apolipoprotein N-acyltransferase
VVGLAGLLFSLKNTSPKQAFWRVFGFGLALFGIGVSWVFVSIYRYGGAPLPLAALLTLVFIVFLSLLLAPLGPLYRLFKMPTWVTFPLLWVGFESLRASLFTGFPWLLMGTAHVESLLGNWAPLGGVWLVSFMVALLASLISVSPLKGMIIGLVLACSAGLSHLSWVHPVPHKTQSVTLIQPNFAPDMALNPAKSEALLQTLKQLSTPFLSRPTWIIWPESALPVSLPYAEGWLLRLTQSKSSTLFVSAPYFYETHPHPNPPPLSGGGDKGNIRAQHPSYTNQIWKVGTPHRYEKQHLVPFGEYVPFEPYLRGLIHFFDLPLSQFSRGQHIQPLQYQDWTIGTTICYEMAYPRLVAQQAAFSDILLNVSNDGWFGSSLGPYQHLQMAQMRAKETGRMIVRSTNTGLSAIIDTKGHLVKILPLGEAGILEAEVQAFSGTTPWVWFVIQFSSVFQKS